MKKLRTVGLIAGLLFLFIGGIGFNIKYRLLWRHHGVYPLDEETTFARGGKNIFLIDRVERVTYSVSHFGWLTGFLGVWPRGDIKGVVLEDRVKIEDDRYGSKFNDRSVAVSFPGDGTTTTTIEFSTNW